MKLLRAVTLIVTVLGLTLLFGCNRTESQLIGKWKNISLEEVVVFKNDKTGTFEVKNNPGLAFKWSILSDNKVKIDIVYMGKTQTLFGKLDNNSFVLEGRDEQAVYKKTD
jgi:hypothetical protein